MEKNTRCGCIHNKKINTIYFAAALFNSRELVMNCVIEEELTKKGYRVFLPQRDGFEFGKLSQVLNSLLDTTDVNPATEDIIYILDMGWGLQISDIAISNYDEPCDPGVIVEMCYAMFACNKRVIGYRTDVRAPYGPFLSELGGQHFFPAYNTQTMIMHFVPSGPGSSLSTTINSIKILADLISTQADKEVSGKCHNCIKNQAPLKNLFNATRLLFKNVLDDNDIYNPKNYNKFLDAIHSTAGLTQITNNWKAYHKQFKLRPIIINPLVNS